MKKRGGKLTCKRMPVEPDAESMDSNCIQIKCVDYEKGLYDSTPMVDCTMNRDWTEYYDEEVKARYYYNKSTGEASWLNPTLNKKSQEIAPPPETEYSSFDRLYREHDDKKAQVQPSEQVYLGGFSSIVLSTRQKSRRKLKIHKNKRNCKKCKTRKRNKRKYFHPTRRLY